MEEGRAVKLFRQRESLKKELERTEKALRPLNDRVCRLIRKIEIASKVDEVWNGMPVYLDIDKRNYEGCISLVDDNGNTHTIRWVHISYTSNGRGRLRTYEITIHSGSGTRYVDTWDRYYPLGKKKISEVQAIVREWITKGTINGEDPKKK